MTRLDSITLLAEQRIDFDVLETAPLLRTRRLVHWAAQHQELIRVWGPSGSGKTTATIDAAAAAGEALDLRAVRVKLGYRPEKLALHRALALGITGSCPDWSGNRLRNYVVDALVERPHLVVFDEVQNLSVAGVEHVRTFWDLHAFAGVLVGDERLAAILGKSPQLLSRTARGVEFEAMSGAALYAFIRRLDSLLEELTDAQLHRVERRVCRANLRTWRHWLIALRQIAASQQHVGVPNDALIDAAIREVL